MARGSRTSEEKTSRSARLTRALPRVQAGLLAGLALTGASMGLANRTDLLGFFHVALAEAFLAVALADLVVAFAIASYRTTPGAWVGRIALLATAAALHVTGLASTSTEAGSEGRAHAAELLPLVADPAWMVSLHAIVLAAAAAGLTWCLLRWTRAPAGGPIPGTVPVTAAASVAAVAAGALAATAHAAVPSVAGAEAAHAPWIARFLVPAETTWGLPVALGIGALALVTLALLPLLDRNGRDPGWRRIAAATLAVAALTFLALTLVASLSAPGHAS